MGAPTSTDSDIVKPLFYPKKLSKEVENMLSSQERLGGPGFVCWWKGIKQSRDFWVETEQEFVRVHIVPRRHLFDPSTWNTRLTGLKDVLLKCIGQRRITEACLCLAEGNLVEVHEGDREGNNELFLDGPWIGRSRFLKIKPITECCLTSTSGSPSEVVDARVNLVAMEHEESAAARRTGREGSQRPLQLDRARATLNLGGATTIGEARQGGGPHARPDQDDLGAAGGRSREGADSLAGKTDPRPDDEAPPRCPEHTGEHGGAIRPLQGIHVPGGASRLLGLGHEGSQSQPECPRGPGQAGNMGVSGDGPQGNHQGLCEEAGHGQGPGGHCGDLATTKPEVGGTFKLIRRLMGESHVQFLTGHSQVRGDRTGHGHRRGDPGGRSRADQGIRSPDRCPEEEAVPEEEVIGHGDHGDLENGGESVDEDYETTEEAFDDEAHGSRNQIRSHLAYENSANNNREIDHGLTISDENETSSGTEFDGGSPRSRTPTSTAEARARAIEGMRRRRFQNRSTKKKLMDGAQHLFSVMATMSVAMGGWAKEVMGEPLWDAWAVLQPQHYMVEEETVDCLELFAGHACISGTFAASRRGVLEPRDIKFNHDLRDPQVQEDIIEDIWRYKPKIVWAAPPCTLWCQFSHLNYPPQELRRLRKKEQKLVGFVTRVFELQSSLGGIMAVENPKGSDLWREKRLFELIRQPGVQFAELDLCQFGLVSCADGRPLRKPVSVLTNNHVFASELSQKCDGSHQHRAIQGRDTAASAGIPKLLERQC